METVSAYLLCSSHWLPAQLNSGEIIILHLDSESYLAFLNFFT
jgi:hypothetical protein